MSLINDALKRAKETQPKGLAPAAGPSLHPVAAERRSGSGSDFLLVLLAVVILSLAGLLLWEWFFGAGSELKVRANSFPAAMQPPPQAEVTQPVTAPAQPLVAAPVVTNAPPKPIAPEPVASAPVVEPPKPMTYKLQSIFYYAKNPSAVINGKTVFVGALVGDVQVVAIGKDSATIMMANGQTKVLELP